MDGNSGWKEKIQNAIQLFKEKLQSFTSSSSQFFVEKIIAPIQSIIKKRPWGKSLDEEMNSDSFDASQDSEKPEWMRNIQEKTKSLFLNTQSKIKEQITKQIQKNPQITEWTQTAQQQWNLLKTSDPRESLERVIGAVQKGGASVWITTTAILLCAFFLADILALVLDRFIPEPPMFAQNNDFGRDRFQSHSSPEEYSILLKRNLFSAEKRTPGASGGNGEPTRTTLPINLIGTLILSDELKSIATIEDKAAASVIPLRIQDEIPGKLKVISITSHKMIFINLANQRPEYTDIPEDAITAPQLSYASAPTTGAGIQQVSSGQFQVARTEINKALENLSSILTQARAIPHFENGVLAGYRLVEIVPNSIYTKLGITENDIICGINGQGLMDPGEAMKSLGDLKTANHLELCIKKPNGKQSNYAYDIR